MPPATLLASVALLNHGGRFHGPFTHVTFITVKLPPCGPHCHLWLPTWDGAGLLWVTFAAVVICWCFFRNRKFLKSFLSTNWELMWSCPEGGLPFIPIPVRPPLISLSFPARALTPALNFLVFFSSSNCVFCIYRSSIYAFSLQNCIKVMAK